MDELDLSRYESVGRRLAWGVVDRCITSGQIDIEGMTDEEVVNTILFDFLNEPEPDDSVIEPAGSSSDDDLYVVTDHSEDLLRKATEAMDSEEYWFAILFYATWVEHWANNILISLSRRSNVPEGVAVALVRSCGFNLKMKDVWTSLGATPIEKDVMRTMTELMELRNGFVHYKWQARISSDKDRHDRKVKEVALAGQKLITILQDIEDQVLFLGRRKSLRAQLGLSD
ncbi:hypothetical protein [Streptomyces sp. NPDC007984]|uniref:hypothetical protein n=1 Tax=Streptomyces sp. NPDC007984 TaxID=3364801 RepID=UPI0036EBF116